MFFQICDVISCCIWNFDTSKINIYDKIVIKTIKNMEIENARLPTVER